MLGNEKGGSGKSTTALHIAVALLKAGQRVATIDLDSRQQSFTRYIENRRAWAKRTGIDLELPHHCCVALGNSMQIEDNEVSEFGQFSAAVSAVEKTCDFIVIDTPGTDSYLMRLAHSMADTLVTPLNDSFLDFDVLGAVDPTTYLGDRRKPLRHDGEGRPQAAPRPRRRHHRLDRGAQSAVDAGLAQQAIDRGGARSVVISSRLPARRWLSPSGWFTANSFRVD